MSNPLCVLSADDAKSMRIKLKNILKKHPYLGILEIEYLDAENGQEAVELYQKHRPGLILLDVHMPEMDGLEALQIIRKNEKETGGDSFIAMVTSDASADAVKTASEAAVDGYIVKPFDVDKINTLVNRYLKTRKK